MDQIAASRLGTIGSRRSLVGIAARWRWGFVVFALALGSVVLWLPYLDLPLQTDVAVYATLAQRWAHGDTLYLDVTTARPQGIFVVYRLLIAARLDSPRAIHAVGALVCAACTLLLLAISTRIFGRAVGLGAAALFALVMASPAVEGFTANAELYALLPTLAAIWLLWCTFEDSGPMPLLAVGLLAALATLLKPTAIAVMPLALFWVAYCARARGAGWTTWIKSMSAIGFGFFGGVFPALLHGSMTVPDLYFGTVLFGRVAHDSVFGLSPGAQIFSLIVLNLSVAFFAPPLLLAPQALWELRRGPSRQRAFLWAWAGTALGGVLLGGSFFPHYWQQGLPPCAIALALMARAAFDQWQPRALRLRQIVIGATLVMLLLAAMRPIINPPTAETVMPYYAQDLPASAVPEIARYLADHTSPDETVFVAYQQPDIYYLADRAPATRWLGTAELSRMPGAFDELLARLATRATAPRYIVGAQDFARWGFDRDGRLRDLVVHDYYLETTIQGVPIYLRNQ